jgi:hypothetical protein
MVTRLLARPETLLIAFNAVLLLVAVYQKEWTKATYWLGSVISLSALAFMR